MFKFFVAIIILAAIVAGGWFTWQHFHPSVPFDPTVSGTGTVDRGPLVQSVASTGTVASNLDVQIKCRASGEVIQLGPKDRTKQFDVSDVVKKGDLLMQVDPIDELRLQQQAMAQVAQSKARLEEARQNLVVAQQQLDQARETATANASSAQAQLVDAQAKAARRKELLAQKLDTQEDYDTAADTAAQMQANVDNANVAIQQLKTQEYMLLIKEQDVKLAEAQLQSDQIALDEANQQLDYCTIQAPLDGVITTLSVEKGTIISSATSVVGGSSVMVLSDMSHIFILADVDEAEIGSVEVGQDVDITADSYPGKHFSGKVIRIATQGVNVSNVVTFEVKIEVTSKNKDMLKLQMTANVQIIQSRKQNVLLVPVAAVIRKEHKEIVQVKNKDGTVTDKPVTLGITDGSNYEVLDGLSQGDTVVLHISAGDSRWNGGQGPGRRM
jgi:HlyD family secretion protein